MPEGGGGGSNNNIFEVKYIFLPLLPSRKLYGQTHFLPFWGQHRYWCCVDLKSLGKVWKVVIPLERMESRDVLGKIWCKTFHERDFCGCQPSILGELARTNMRRMNTKVLGNMSKYWTTKVINTMLNLYIFNRTKKYSAPPPKYTIVHMAEVIWYNNLRIRLCDWIY